MRLRRYRTTYLSTTRISATEGGKHDALLLFHDLVFRSTNITSEQPDLVSAVSLNLERFVIRRKPTHETNLQP